MDETVQRVRVVVVSPGDVAKERQAVQDVVDELNRGIAVDRGCHLSLWRWEIDARSGMHVHGPQGLVDELMDIQDVDVVIGVFWKRLGTPTHDAGSGTEHELRRAWAAWNEHRRPEVMVYFCKRPYTPQMPEEARQWVRVLEFQQELPGEQLWWAYKTLREFEALLREHLTRYLRGRDPVPPPHPAPRSTRGRRVVFNLPAAAAAFTGRDRELAALDEALAVVDRTVITLVVTGMGGVGKSQLAARYAQHATGYDIVAWIRAEDGGTADLALLAANLGAPEESLSPNDRAQLALARLTDEQRRWLLVLDNVEGPKQLEELLPRTGNGRVLVTSRDRALGQFGALLAVDVFDEDTATGYLSDGARRPHDEEAGRELAQALGCLPLALSHAAAYCQSGTSFGEYQELLSGLPARELFASHPEEFYAQTVASTWKTSIAAASEVAALAPGVLEMAAQLGADAIPKSLFGVLRDDTPMGHHRLAVALNTLARLNLATVDDTTVSVHRLIQKVVADDAAARGQQSAGLHALKALYDAFPADAELALPANWPRCEQLLSHVLALAQHSHRRGYTDVELFGLLNRATDYLVYAGDPERGIAVAETAGQHAHRMLGAEHPDTLTARHSLAGAYQAAGRTEDAIAIYESLLSDTERILGSEHPNALTARHSLAGAYRAAGRTAAAITILESLLRDTERILGPGHPDMLASLHELGLVYDAAGRTAEAIAIYEPLLSVREGILGPEHPGTLATRHALAYAYQATGRTQDAIAIYEQLLSDAERIFGPEHPRTLAIHHALAYTYQATGRTEDAIAIYEPLLGVEERILGHEHHSTLMTRHNLAGAYDVAGRMPRAIKLYESLLADRRRILGPEHPDTLRTRDVLARAYRTAGRRADAQRVMKRSGSGR